MDNFSFFVFIQPFTRKYISILRRNTQLLNLSQWNSNEIACLLVSNCKFVMINNNTCTLLEMYICWFSLGMKYFYNFKTIYCSHEDAYLVSADESVDMKIQSVGKVETAMIFTKYNGSLFFVHRILCQTNFYKKKYCYYIKNISILKQANQSFFM